MAKKMARNLYIYLSVYLFLRHPVFIFFILFRQDAVMQQVFGLMNNLLATAALGPKSTNNKLSIRTFKVVPLSQRSGNFDMKFFVIFDILDFLDFKTQ